MESNVDCDLRQKVFIDYDQRHKAFVDSNSRACLCQTMNTRVMLCHVSQRPASHSSECERNRMETMVMMANNETGSSFNK